MEYIEELITILVASGIVYWGAWVAQKNNRNVPLAAFWSVLFGIFAVAVYYIMGDKNGPRNLHKEVKEASNDNEVTKSSNLQ